MGKFYSKFKRLFFCFAIANMLFVIVQLWFFTNHLIQHQWWAMAFSLCCGSINAWGAVSQYNHWQRVKREEKEYMWTTLSTPSEALR